MLCSEILRSVSGKLQDEDPMPGAGRGNPRPARIR